MEPIIILAMFWCYYRSKARIAEEPLPVLNSVESHEWMRTLIEQGIENRQILQALGVRASTLKRYWRYDFPSKHDSQYFATKYCFDFLSRSIKREVRQGHSDYRDSINAESLKKLELSEERRKCSQSVADYYFNRGEHCVS